MSQENVEIVRSLYERLNAADDIEAAVSVAEEVIDPEIEFEISWRSGRDAADFRVLHGIEEVRTVLAELMAPFSSFRWEIHESFDAGDEVVLILESLVTPNESAAEISTCATPGRRLASRWTKFVRSATTRCWPGFATSVQPAASTPRSPARRG